MIDQFLGSWKLVDSENFDEFMKSLGVSSSVRIVGNVLKPTLILTKRGDYYTMRTETTFKTTEILFKLGIEFDETTADERKAKTLIIFEDNALIQTQKWDDKEIIIKRELVDEQMVVTSKTTRQHRQRTNRRHRDHHSAWRHCVVGGLQYA
uniref:Myelin P2 protein-like isoform X1 n=1 Tax=Geotrypetes seraphini TaxID=260995 RepID=A0A6P8QQ86_GEOSA|nr:myelin P2 protein-like isoform X1 [Geotrypetes seraphini]XP_033789693.1 myelin P2 protein-like isoform X1 [Geotrypetes seraphini]